MTARPVPRPRHRGADALDRRKPDGVWGGKLVIGGAIVEVERGRGRPPATPRPPLVR